MGNRISVHFITMCLIAIIFFAVGIIPLVRILKVCFEDYSIEHYGTRVDAQVIGKKKSVSSKDITYELKYKDVVYEKEYTYSFLSDSDAGEEGDLLEICYKNDSPDKVFVPIEKNNNLILLIVLACFAAVMTWIGYVCIRSVVRS